MTLVKNITKLRKVLEYGARQEADRRLIAKLKRKENAARGKAWLDEEHEFQYVHGDHKIGKPMVMTGRKARERNRDLEDKFFKDNSPDARLGRWYWIDKPRDATAPTGHHFKDFK